MNGLYVGDCKRYNLRKYLVAKNAKDAAARAFNEDLVWKGVKFKKLHNTKSSPDNMFGQLIVAL